MRDDSWKLGIFWLPSFCLSFENKNPKPHSLLCKPLPLAWRSHTRTLTKTMAFNQIYAIEELLRGHESAKKLQKLVNQPDLDSITKEDLVSEILESFENTLACYDGHKSSEDSTESIRSKMRQDRRGSCERRYTYT